MDDHRVVTHEEWLEARRALLAKEKDFTRARDRLAEERRELPWEAVTEVYRFEGETGERTLTDLFDGRSQLIVYHFMFDPADDAGCPHCSFWADNFDGTPVHLGARDISFVAVSRAPYAKIADFKARMGWAFPWYSSYGTRFTYDLGVAFSPEALADGSAVYNYGSTEPGLEDREGISAFARTASGDVFHTYSAYARGIDIINGAYHMIDLTPTGRDEPKDAPQFWVRRHDEY
jgi:predicted dithiol-disulfide oxidoreductase (DUF899 family)